MLSPPDPSPAPWQGIEDTVNWDIVVHNSSADTVYAVTTDPDGNVYVVGRGRYLSSTLGHYEWWLKKYDAAGREIRAGWDKQLYFSGTLNDTPTAVAIDGEGNVVVGGYYTDSHNLPHCVVRKYNPDGTELLAVNLSSYQLLLADMAIGDDGAIYLAGSTLSVPTAGIFLKLNAAGEEVWSKTISVNGVNRNIQATALALDGAGNVVIGGYGIDLVGDPSGYDSWFQVYSPDGMLLREVRFSARIASFDPTSCYTNDRLYDITVDADGNIYTVGCGYGIALVVTQIDEHTSAATACDCDAGWLNKFSPTGQRLDQKVFLTRDGNDVEFRSIVPDGRGGVFISGRDCAANNASGRFWIIRRLDGELNEIWGANFEVNQGASTVVGEGLALDRSGALFAISNAHDIHSADSGLDWWIKKFY
ncbi:MAG TPA: hypothetical protein ENN69_06690 [Spirochaetia bacterium]|nr:hypothetical protein [Spirochaetia bacterium]